MIDEKKLIEKLKEHAFPLTYNFVVKKYLEFDKAIEIVGEIAGNQKQECNHDFFCVSRTNELQRSIGSYGEWKHFRIATLACKHCAETRQIEVDVYTKKH